MTEHADLRRPRRTDDSSLHRLDEGAVLWRDQPLEAVTLNPTALALWELCDGQTSVDEMVTAVCAVFAIEPARARADVEVALAEMRAAGMLR